MNKTKKTGKGRGIYACFATLAVIILIAAVGLTSQPMVAEAKGRFSPPRSVDEIMQTMTERLDLTPEQAEAVRPIIGEKVRLHNEIRGKTHTERKARRVEMQKLRWNTEIGLSEILTDEQVDKYLELKQEQRKEFKRGKHRGGWMKKGMHNSPEQVIERLRTRLDLSGEQTLQAGHIIKESSEKRRVVFDRYREQGLKLKQAMRSEMQAIGDSTHAELATILSDEQIEELDAMKEEKRVRMDKWQERSGKGEY